MKLLWEYRDVTLSLIRRNIAGRYKSTALGFAWNLITPVALICIFNLVFGTIRPKPIADFWIYLSAGMFPVTFMSGCLRGNAITSSANFVKKMSFPREILVFSNVLSQFVTLVFAYLIVIIIILFMGQEVNWVGMAILPFALLIMLFFGFGCCFLVSTATVFVKDIANLASLIMRLVIWITPTFFLVSDATGLLEAIIWWNPFTYFVEIFHQIIYYKMVPELNLVITAICITVVTFVIGRIYFAKMEDRFPEVL